MKCISPVELTRLLKCDRGIAALEFVLLAPVLLMLMFSIVVYSLYFTTAMGVRQAAAEGARTAVAGLSPAERDGLARLRAQAVIDTYGSMMRGATITTLAGTGSTAGTFKVTVSYDMKQSPVRKYVNIVPLPASSMVESTITVTNGGY